MRVDKDAVVERLDTVTGFDGWKMEKIRVRCFWGTDVVELDNFFC